MPRPRGDLRRIHIQLETETYDYLLRTVGPYKIGVVVRRVMQNYVKRRLDEERRLIDQDKEKLAKEIEMENRLSLDF